jgi:hypothetical protein
MRDHQPIIILELRGKTIDRSGLTAKVEFLPHGPFELRHQLARPHVNGLRKATFNQGRQFPEDIGVDFHHVQEARPLDLHRRLTAVRQDRPVNLGNGSRREGLPVEAVKQGIDAGAQFTFHYFNRLLRREGGNVLLELLQFFLQLPGNKVRPVAEDLPEFDEGGTQLLDGHTDPHPGGCLFDRKLSAGGPAPALRPENAPQGPQDSSSPRLVYDFPESVDCENREDLPVPGEPASAFALQQAEYFHCLLPTAPVIV